MVNSAEPPPSARWAALNYQGNLIARVLFDPEDEAFSVRFRIPADTFRIPGVSQLLTLLNLLKAVGIAAEQVDSWRQGDVSKVGMGGSNPELKRTLAPPPPGASHLDVDVCLTRAEASVGPAAGGEAEDEVTSLEPPPTESAGMEVPPETVAPLAAGSVAEEGSNAPLSQATWQELELNWRTILGLEATVDGLRASAEGVVSELENLSKQTLGFEEKTEATRADITSWERAKKRIPFVLPKLKDFIHRAIWLLSDPERKQLETLYKDSIEPRIPFPHVANVLNELEVLRKARQNLLAIGNTVQQEGRGVANETQGALQTLKSNAAANVRRRREASRGGKFFKDVRRMSGL